MRWVSLSPRRDGNLPSGNVVATSFLRVNRNALLRNTGNLATQAVSLPYGTNFGDGIWRIRLE